jgi:hypothetical protein
MDRKRSRRGTDDTSVAFVSLAELIHIIHHKHALGEIPMVMPQAPGERTHAAQPAACDAKTVRTTGQRG